ncbi:hypothetical protein AciX8_2554 [Granulicella mallensis MP5ACTX8]|uniref:Uncharacterized protein n=1 Tax=Granulicella mallensis (strain ATCC BAA-1857 / DSM 23137 / MP5ACTX8) TaxID=682795 RepID=G8P073_GRAMM|nr:hypothetical protein AciX8_2554 [Granulicella mallensis MP5ACTX8]
MNENQAGTIVPAWFSLVVPAWQRHRNVYITAWAIIGQTGWQKINAGNRCLTTVLFHPRRCIARNRFTVSRCNDG